MKDNKFEKRIRMKKYIFPIFLLMIFVGCTNSAEQTKPNSKPQYNTQKASIKSKDFLTENALHDAIRANDIELVKFLVKQGVEINQQDEYGYTPLHLAVRLHNYEIVQYLIKKGANVNSKDNFKDTPLLDSTRNDDTDISKELICNGAYRNVYDQHQMSTLHNSSKNNNKYISTLLRADTVEPYCQEEIKIDIDKVTTSSICGNIKKGYVVSVKVNVEDDAGDVLGELDAKVDNSKKQWCVDIKDNQLKKRLYTINALGEDYVVNNSEATKEADFRTLEISIDDQNTTFDTTPKICGDIVEGNIVKVDVSLKDTKNNLFGVYESNINNDTKRWCTNIKKPLAADSYQVIATGYNKNNIQTTATNELSILEDNLAIKIDTYNTPLGNKPKICGDIVNGDITLTNITLTNENNETFGKYEAKIKDKRWCANVSDELKNGIYKVNATGVDEDEKEAKDNTNIEVYVIPGLYDALVAEFKDDFEPWKAEIDKDTLTWRFKNPTVLFQVAKKDLKPQFQEILDNFFPRYINILKDYEQEIETVVVEGHSSSEHRLGKTEQERFDLNEKLSQSRANEVLEYAKESSDFRVMNNIVWILNKFKAQGMSSSQLVYNLDGSENKELSRRVEFRIQTLKQKLIKGQKGN